MTNDKPKNLWVLKGEDWTLKCLSGCLPFPVTHPHLSYFSCLLAFRPFMFGICARFHCRSSWCRVCEVRLFGSCLSARASVSPPPVSSQIPNRLSKRCLKQKHNFYVLSSKKRRGCKEEKKPVPPGGFPALLGITVARMSDSTWASINETEQALCISKPISCHARM